jgi:hypothetical protein
VSNILPLLPACVGLWVLELAQVALFVLELESIDRLIDFARDTTMPNHDKFTH